MSVRDQLASAAVQHGAQVIARGGLGLAALAVRTWVYVWLAPAAAVPFIRLAFFRDASFGAAMHESLFYALGVSMAWFLPSMAVAAFAMIVIGSFRVR